MIDKIKTFAIENPTITLLNVIMFLIYSMAISILNKKIEENPKNKGAYILMGIMLTIMYGLTLYVSFHGSEQ